MPDHEFYLRFHSALEAFRFANDLRSVVASAIEKTQGKMPDSNDLFPQGAQTICSKERITHWCKWYRCDERRIPLEETPPPEYIAGEERVLRVLHSVADQPISDLCTPLLAVEAEFRPILIQAIEASAPIISRASEQTPADLIRIAARVGGEGWINSREAVEEIISVMVGAVAMPAAPSSDRRAIEGVSPGRAVKGPAYERLTLYRSCDGSDHTAILNGTKIRIRGDAAFRMLDVLQKKRGGRVKAALLKNEIKQRPDRVMKVLDERLQRIIDPPKNGVGYAML